jgi:hypothetical protein
MKVLEDKSRAYRTKGSLNKNKKVEDVVDQLEAQVLEGKEVPSFLDCLDKPRQPHIIGPVQPKEKFMVDGNEIYNWLKCLKENKEGNKNYNADSKHLMDEILAYIDRQRVKQ